jgi:hypothetical protein
MHHQVLHKKQPVAAEVSMNRTQKLYCHFVMIIGMVISLGWTSSAQAETPVLSDGAALTVTRAQLDLCLRECGDKKGVCPNEAIVDTCRTELSSCKELNEAWRVAYAELADRCHYVPLAEPGHPKRPDRPKSTGTGTPPTPPPPKLIRVCEDGAVPDGNVGCKCEDADARPVQKIDRRGHGPVYFVACVPTMEAFKNHIADDLANFNELCPPDGIHPDTDIKGRCQSAGSRLAQVFVWYRGLVENTFPLTVENWTIIHNEAKALRKELNEIRDALEVLCPVISEKPKATLKERCVEATLHICPLVPEHPEFINWLQRCDWWHKVLVETANKSTSSGNSNVEVRVGMEATALIRPGTSGAYGGRVSVSIIRWYGQDGVGGGFLVGGGDDKANDGRFTGGVRLFYARKLDKDGTFEFRAGFLVQGEAPVRGHTQSAGIGPEIGIRVRIVKGLSIDVGVAVLAERHIDARGHLTDTGVAVQPSGGIDLHWHTEW